MEMQDPSYGVVVYARDYVFRPFSEEVTALRLEARRRSTGLYAYVLQGCEPFTLRRGWLI